MHADLSNVPIENVKDVGMDLTYKAIEYIKNSDHCLADSFRAEEGISVKQYREFSINIGTKPDVHKIIDNIRFNMTYIFLFKLLNEFIINIFLYSLFSNSCFKE